MVYLDIDEDGNRFTPHKHYTIRVSLRKEGNRKENKEFSKANDYGDPDWVNGLKNFPIQYNEDFTAVRFSGGSELHALETSKRQGEQVL